MILTDNNIKLVRLTEDDIELVRTWRNDPKISQYMFFRDYITKEMQKEWFKKINNDHNYYFIIEVDNKKIGLTEIKNIDYDKMIAEGGIFIYDDNYLNSDIPYKVIFLLYDFAFYKLKIKFIMIKILDNNKRAIRFNTSLGFKKYNSENYKYILDIESYERAKLKIIKFIKV